MRAAQREQLVCAPRADVIDSRHGLACGHVCKKLQFSVRMKSVQGVAFRRRTIVVVQLASMILVGWSFEQLLQRCAAFLENLMGRAHIGCTRKIAGGQRDHH